MINHVTLVDPFTTQEKSKVLLIVDFGYFANFSVCRLVSSSVSNSMSFISWFSNHLSPAAIVSLPSVLNYLVKAFKSI